MSKLSRQERKNMQADAPPRLQNGRAKVPDLLIIWGSLMRKPATKSKPAPLRAAIPAPTRSRFPVWLMAVLLMLATIALYWPAMRCDFINYDDPDYVTENVHVQDRKS